MTELATLLHIAGIVMFYLLLTEFMMSSTSYIIDVLCYFAGHSPSLEGRVNGWPTGHGQNDVGQSGGH